MRKVFEKNELKGKVIVIFAVFASALKFYYS
jgi:hypothetical protein